MIGVRFSAEEIALVEEACKEIGLPLATYVRTVVLQDVAKAHPTDPVAKARMDKQIQELGEAFARILVKAHQDATQEKKGRKRKAGKE